MFLEKFKTYTNTELLRIIDNPDDYQSEAVEAAKTIFADRQLSEEEIKLAKDELEIEKKEELESEEKIRAIENKFKKLEESIFEKISPFQKEIPTTEKTIRMISLIFGGLFLLQLYSDFGLIISVLSDSVKDWDITVAFYFLDLLIVPIATILFYKKSKIGWFLLTMYMTYSAVLTIGLIIMGMNMRSNSIGTNLFPQTPIITYILMFLFYAGVIWVISKENMRSIYAITKRSMIVTIVITALIVWSGIRILYY